MIDAERHVAPDERRTSGAADDRSSRRSRNIECGPTAEERLRRPSRSGRGQRDREAEPTGRQRRHES